MKNIKTYEDFVNEEINLKKALTTGALAAGMAFSNPAISQTNISNDIKIPTTKVVKRVDEYIDSLQKALVDKQVYIMPKSERVKKYGYGFCNSIDGTYNYMMKDNYEKYVNRYFVINNIHKSTKSENQYIIEMKSKDSLNEVIFVKFSFNPDYPMNDKISEIEKSLMLNSLLLTSYFEKLKSNIGRTIVSTSWNTEGDIALDINTGKVVQYLPGTKWKCVDITIDEKFGNVAGVMVNNKSEKILVDLGYFPDVNYKRGEHDNAFYNLKDAEYYSAKFGQTNWLKILKGEVSIGFTKEMVKLSIGDGYKTSGSHIVKFTSDNKPIPNPYKQETWNYDSFLIFFKNDRVSDSYDFELTK